MAKRKPNPIPPEYASQWHPIKNGAARPEDYSAGVKFKAWWVCEKNHEFQTAIADFTKGHGCPYCAGNKAWPGYNDLATLNPAIASEWHPAKNLPLSASQVTIGSKTKVWWIGKCGHEFLQSVGARTISGNNCPYCAGQKVLAGWNDLKTTHPEVAERWHPTKNNDLTPDRISAGTNKKVWWLDTCGHEFMTSIAEKIRSGKGCPYCAGKSVLTGFNDLKFLFPDIAAEWDDEKNENRTPETVSAKSTVKTFWICNEGHSYETSIRARTKDNTGCPYCSGQRILAGLNDLVTTHPEIAADWDYEKNQGLSPTGLSYSSDKKVFWICETGKHSYEMRINSRTNKTKNASCNICSNRTFTEGLNDLATRHPEMSLEWHPTKNGTLKASDVLRSHREDVWWLCEKGHDWQVSPMSRLSKFSQGDISGCPSCTLTTYSSKAEREIAEILTRLGETVKVNDRSLLRTSELDIYLPERHIAIEYNGLYWHTIERNGKHRNSHYDKWLNCRETGVQLIQIWEDDWLRNRNVILRSLIHKLGISEKAAALFPELGIINKDKVFARKTGIRLLTLVEAQEFMEQNHIQGFASGSYYIGLIAPTGEICAAIILKQEKGGTLNIIRYATDRTVPGGFTKLLKHAGDTWNPRRFLTFSDNCISDGSLYANNGFVQDKDLPPDYMYVVGRSRKHKFGYRLARFKNDPMLKWMDGLTEKQLADLNGLYRIYDAGKIRWVLNRFSR